MVTTDRGMPRADLRTRHTLLLLTFRDSGTPQALATNPSSLVLASPACLGSTRTV